MGTQYLDGRHGGEQVYRYRINDLRKVPPRCASCPGAAAGAITGLDLTDIRWAIVGGESGPGARTMQREWVVEIRRQCRQQEVQFFFKQWGGFNKKAAGRMLNGRTYDAMPELPSLFGQQKLAV